MKEAAEKVVNQKRGYLGSVMGVGLPVIKTVLIPLSKNFLLVSGLTAAAAPPTNASIQKKIYGSGMTRFIISNEGMKYIMKIIKALSNLVYW